MIHTPEEKPESSGWYIATRQQSFTQCLYECEAYGLRHLILPRHYIYFSKLFNIWLTVNQKYYWFSLRSNHVN